MADINSLQQKEIGAIQSDIKHISASVKRIEDMMIEHNKSHALMNQKVNKRLSAAEFWINTVKWGAGVLTGAIILFAPAFNKVIQNRPTEERVVAIIQKEFDLISTEKKDENEDEE